MKKPRKVSFDTDIRDTIRSRDLNISQVWQRFELSMKSKNRSDETILTYKKHVTKFSRFVLSTKFQVDADKLTLEYMDDLSIDMFTSNDVIGFMIHISLTEKLKNASIINLGKVLRVFFKFVAKTYKVEDLSEYIELPSEEKRVKYTPTPEHIREYLSGLDTSVFKDFRTYFIITLLTNTGIRLGELQIPLSNIDMTNRRIIINGKGNKQREISINDKLFNVMKIYLKERNTFAICDMLLVTEHGTPLKTRSISKDLHDLAELTGIPISGHSCRRYFIKTLIDNNVNPLLVSKIVGHTSPKVIMDSYYLANDKDIKQAMNVIRREKEE